jgi:hypothetical protein
MTSFAMIAGMIPMAIGLGEGGDQTAPLGRAVVGGLAGATLATLLVLPALFAIVQRDTTRKTASLDPSDPASRHFRGNGDVAADDTIQRDPFSAGEHRPTAIPEGAIHG